jgi:hypothetical protein
VPTTVSDSFENNRYFTRVYATTRGMILGNSTGNESEKIPSCRFGVMPRR